MAVREKAGIISKKIEGNPIEKKNEEVKNSKELPKEESTDEPKKN